MISTGILNASAEIVYSRFRDAGCDFQDRRQECLILANQFRLLWRAVDVQYPEQNAQDDGHQGQQCRRHIYLFLIQIIPFV